MVWKTNFDQVEYNEVLQSHKARVRGDPAPPTIHDIPPRTEQRPRNPSTQVSDVTAAILVLVCSSWMRAQNYETWLIRSQA